MSRPEAELAILALYATYNRALDAGDAVGWAATFAQDGTFHHPARPWKGRDELRQFVQERTARFGTNPVIDQRHWNDAVTLEIDREQAKGTCDLLVAGVNRDDGSLEVVVRGRYEDRLQLQKDGWRFAERWLTVL